MLTFGLQWTPDARHAARLVDRSDTVYLHGQLALICDAGRLAADNRRANISTDYNEALRESQAADEELSQWDAWMQDRRQQYFDQTIWDLYYKLAEAWLNGQNELYEELATKLTAPEEEEGYIAEAYQHIDARNRAAKAKRRVEWLLGEEHVQEHVSHLWEFERQRFLARQKKYRDEEKSERRRRQILLKQNKQIAQRLEAMYKANRRIRLDPRLETFLLHKSPADHENVADEQLVLDQLGVLFEASSKRRNG